MAFVDPSKGEWRCSCPTPGDPSAYDLSAHPYDVVWCSGCCTARPEHVKPPPKPFCGECNPNPNNKRPKTLQGLCADCLSKVKPLTDEEIEAAVEEGREAREACLEMGMVMRDTGMRFR